MKKILIGTTALLAAGAFVSTAQASDPIKLQLGGYMEYWVAGASQDGDYKDRVAVNNFDVAGESEVHFKGSTTLDNGMKISVQVELEAGSNNNDVGGQNDVIDESYMTLEGKYGKAIIGSENDVAYLMQVDAPEASEMGGAYASSEGDMFTYLPSGVNVLDTKLNGLSDQNKISYFTPKFYGLQGGVSYTPSNNGSGDDTFRGAVSGTSLDGAATSEDILKRAGLDDAWSFGLSYANTFSGVGVKATAGYIVIDDATASRVTPALHNQDTEIQEFAGGLAVSYQGFTVGGGAKRRIANANTVYAATDGVAWNAGVMYAEGPYKVSLNYLNSSVVAARGVAGEDEVDAWRVGASYTMGPGVILFGQVAYLDSSDELATVKTDNEGAFGGVVGLHLNF
ncbi:porin [Oleispirillum naphthae]|uniref:porin n=1 Tax=Oleispirillum naphthae TaxID=2838853 RepID=UPI0030823C4E